MAEWCATHNPCRDGARYCGRVPVAGFRFVFVTSEGKPPFHSGMRGGVGALAFVFVLAACGNPGTALNTSPSPSEVATPTPSESPSPSPAITPSPLPPASPIPVPPWAVMKAACTGQPNTREAILVLKAAPTTKILADASDPLHPKTICKLSGGGSPVLVTDTEISWAASEHRPGTAGTSV